MVANVKDQVLEPDDQRYSAERPTAETQDEKPSKRKNSAASGKKSTQNCNSRKNPGNPETKKDIRKKLA
jgi:hypothetical protein